MNIATKGIFYLPVGKRKENNVRLCHPRLSFSDSHKTAIIIPQDRYYYLYFH